MPRPGRKVERNIKAGVPAAKQRRDILTVTDCGHWTLTHHGHVTCSGGHVGRSSHVGSSSHVPGGGHVLLEVGDQGEAGQEEGLAPAEAGQQVELEDDLLQISGFTSPG